MGSQKQDFKMEFDIGTIKHLGLQMYSTLPPVIGELVSNAWDADATNVYIQIPVGVLDETSEITVLDDGKGMTDEQVRTAYLIVGRDRREEERRDETVGGRKVMGRKGIGKFSAFGIANEIEIETVTGSEVSRFIMNYDQLKASAVNREIKMPCLEASDQVTKGTRIVLRNINKFKKKPINTQELKRGLARRFSIVGEQHNFQVHINNITISAEDRDLKRLLEIDSNGSPYLWEFNNEEIHRDSGLMISGWIGALKRSSILEDGIQRGIVIMARGKMVQEPFVFDAEVGQQFALSYIVGEIYAEFVDEESDTVGTTRNSLVWDSENNMLLLEWGKKEVNKIAREWASKRSDDNERELIKNPLYQTFLKSTQSMSGGRRIKKVADALIRKTITSNTIQATKENEKVVQLCIDFIQFDSFQDLAEEMSKTENLDINKLIQLFRECEIMEAKEMMRVTQSRITTIEKLQNLIDNNALEVPTLHNFLKEFPWVIDPRWTLISDEIQYSTILNNHFPELADTLEENKRIDFLCVKEGDTLIVVEIKRPQSRVSAKELRQIEEYVNFMRDSVTRTTDPEHRHSDVIGYLLCGDRVDTPNVRGIANNLERAQIYVRRYSDLLRMVENIHKEFLSKYTLLKQAKDRQV